MTDIEQLKEQIRMRRLQIRVATDQTSRVKEIMYHHGQIKGLDEVLQMLENKDFGYQLHPWKEAAI